MKLKLFVILLLITAVKADFIIPFTDNYYNYHGLLQTTGQLKITTIEPVYRNEQIKVLKKAQTRESKYYTQKLYPKLKNKGFNSPFFSLDTFLEATKSILLLKENFDDNLLTYQDEQVKIFLQGKLGYQYDNKYSSGNDYNRTREYWGMNLYGNLYDNFGFYTGFSKGHYNGDEEFIMEDPHLTKMQNGSGEGLYAEDGDYHKIDMVSETDFKNKYVNLSLGYGQLKIGESLTSSVILDNENVGPYGYFKYYKGYKNFYYTALWANLTPDSLVNYNYREDTFKSMALHTLAYRNGAGSFVIGAGNSIIFGDTPIDLGYISPFALYKVMDNKNHGRDNTMFFVYLEHRPLNGFRYYFNYVADDIRMSRWTDSKIWTSYQAFQAGFYYAPFGLDLPLLIGAESTIIGSGIYNHKTGLLSYKHDRITLGYNEGSNLMSNTVSVQYIMPKIHIKAIYQNILHDHLNNLGEREFLGGADLLRKQRLTLRSDIYLLPKFKIYVEYQHKVEENSANYLLSGIECEF